MKRQLLTLAIAAASFAAAPLAFAQDPQATPDPQQSAQAGQVTWADLDTDHDGNLSRTEAQAVDSLSQAFDSADADKDGMLTADEYKAYLASQQTSPAPTTDDAPPSDQQQ